MLTQFGAAANVSLALAPGAITADGSTTSIATAKVTDASSNPVTGDTVAFSSSGYRQIGTASAGATAGAYQATITSTTSAGQATITATDTTASLKPFGTATLTQAKLGQPTAAVGSPADGGSYNPIRSVATTFSCTKATGGAAITAGTDDRGGGAPAGSLDTFTVSAHAYTVAATSTDGQITR